jgi:hypothetical protein
MNILTRADLKMLMEGHQRPGISLFMPTHRAGEQTRQDPIRLKNLLREAETHLERLGVKAQDRESLLAPLGQLMVDMPLWRARGDGLAAFRSPDSFRFYRLPLSLTDLVLVGDSFHIKPLLPLFIGDQRFYVLAFSQKQVRLLECTRHSVREVELRDTPGNFEEALRHDQPERQVQVRSSGPAGAAGATIFHGHGGAAEAKQHKRDLARYAQLVNKGLRAVLRDSTAPLLLAAVDYLVPIYREANTYTHLIPEAILGSPDARTPEDLRDAAYRLVEPLFQKDRQVALDRYQALIGKGPASHDLPEIVHASYLGRVDSLLVTVGRERWGTFDPESGAVFLHHTPQAGDLDLADFAAMQTLRHGGLVYPLQPAEAPDTIAAAAVFRY